MIVRGILRGGLVGAVLAAAFSALGVIPICGFAALPLRMAAWAFGGYVGGRIAVTEDKNSGVAAGAAAGVLAGIIDGIVYTALSPVRFRLAGDTMTSLYLLPQGLVDTFNEMGINLLAMDTVGGSVFLASTLCMVTWLFAGILGAIGGGIAQALAE